MDLLRTWTIALLVGGMTVSSTVTRAQDAGEGTEAAEGATEGANEGQSARDLFLRGQAAYERGDYEEAAAAWEAGYELDPRPLLQYNLGQAYERLGELPKAVAAFELYLEHASPEDPNQQRARAQLAAIRERLGRTAIVVRGGPEGATILVDGEDHGRTPRPDAIAVEPGSHRIEVVKDGYRSFEAMVSVAAGRTVEVEPVMEEAPDESELPLVPIILWSAGGASLIAGAVLGGIALGKANGADTSDGPDADTARGLAIGADIAFGVGVLAAGAGLLVFLLADDDGGESSDEMTFTPTVGPGFAGALVEGRF